MGLGHGTPESALYGDLLSSSAPYIRTRDLAAAQRVVELGYARIVGECPTPGVWVAVALVR